MRKEMTLALWVLALLMVMPAWLSALGPAAEAPPTLSESNKPGSPVSVSIEPAGGNVNPGGVAELLVAVSSSIDSDDVLVSLKATGGAELLSTEQGWTPSKASWTLKLLKGDRESRTITVRFPEHPGGRLSARVTLSDGSGGRYSARTSIGTEPPGKGPLPEGKRAVDSRGREIIEYRAE
jgi:hypothetical protein